MPWFQEWWALAIPIALCLAAIAWTVLDNLRLSKLPPAPDNRLRRPGAGPRRPAGRPPAAQPGRNRVGGSLSPKATAVIFVDTQAEQSIRRAEDDIQRAMELAAERDLIVLDQYMAGPRRPNAFTQMLHDVREQRIAVVITPRARHPRLPEIRELCDVIAVDTRSVYPRRSKSPRHAEVVSWSPLARP